MSGKKVKFTDVSFRDGVQSLWSMNLTYGMVDAVAEEMDQAGYEYIELPMHAVYFKMMVLFLRENPWDMMRLFNRKITKTNKSISIFNNISLLENPEPRSMIRFWYEFAANITGASRFFTFANTKNELDRHFPWLVPMAIASASHLVSSTNLAASSGSVSN